MKTALITGIHGFVGSHLSVHLMNQNNRITGLDLPGVGPDLIKQLSPDIDLSENTHFSSDLSSIDELKQIFMSHEIDYIFHLAGIAFVPYGWESPAGILKINTLGTVNLLQAARDTGWAGRFLYISSSDVYGSLDKNEMPITENTAVNPNSPYAVSKFAAEQFALLFNKFDFDVIIARPFNHIGPGQNNKFVVPSFLNRIIEAKKKNSQNIQVGDLSSGRDFTDVRDVVNAYTTLLERGSAGKIYNICTGNSVVIQKMFELTLEAVGVKLDYNVDDELMRKEGTNIRYGSADKIKKLGWQPEYSLEKSIKDSYNFILEYDT